MVYTVPDTLEVVTLLYVNTGGIVSVVVEVRCYVTEFYLIYICSVIELDICCIHGNVSYPVACFGIKGHLFTGPRLGGIVTSPIVQVGLIPFCCVVQIDLTIYLYEHCCCFNITCCCDVEYLIKTACCIHLCVFALNGPSCEIIQRICYHCCEGYGIELIDSDGLGSCYS